MDCTKYMQLCQMTDENAEAHRDEDLCLQSIGALSHKDVLMGWVENGEVCWAGIQWNFYESNTKFLHESSFENGVL